MSRYYLMDIANVVFVCGRYIRRNDPLLEVENMVYSNIVAGFSFSLLQHFGNLARAVSTRLSNLHIAGSETSILLLAIGVVFLPCASWFCQQPGSSPVWRYILFVPTGLTKQMRRNSLFKGAASLFAHP